MKIISLKPLKIAGTLILALFAIGADAHARCETTSRSTPALGRLSRSLIYFGNVPIQFSATPPTIKGNISEHCSLPYWNVVELLVDGRIVASSNSYHFRNTFNWNSAGVPDGEHTVEVRSRDSDNPYDYSRTSFRIRTNNTDVRSEVFDLAAYLKFNPEVASAYPGDATQQVQHWLTFGVNEGRRASFFFHSLQYLEAYPDLQKAFGAANYASAIRHYLTFGLSEGRGGVHALRKEIFDARWYLRKHADLTRAFGTEDVNAARLHFVVYGLKEGRASSPNFSVKNYLARYGDLRKAYGKDYEAAARHYSVYGIREKRNAK